MGGEVLIECLGEAVVPAFRKLCPDLAVVFVGIVDFVADDRLLQTLPFAVDDLELLPAESERLGLCFLIIAPPAFLMGFPMSVAMTTLGRLGKEHMFIWAWGVNGCFSVIGAAAAPVLSTQFGLASVIEVAAFAYFLAWPAFGGVMSRRVA